MRAAWEAVGAQRQRGAPEAEPGSSESSREGSGPAGHVTGFQGSLLSFLHPTVCLQVTLLSTEIKKPFSQMGLAQRPCPLEALPRALLGQKFLPAPPAAPGLPEPASLPLFCSVPSIKLAYLDWIFWLKKKYTQTHVFIIKTWTAQRNAKMLKISPENSPLRGDNH